MSEGIEKRIDGIEKRLDRIELRLAIGAKKKNPAAVALGKLGGQRKVPKGLATMTEERKNEIAEMGRKARAAKANKEKPA